MLIDSLAGRSEAQILWRTCRPRTASQEAPQPSDSKAARTRSQCWGDRTWETSSLGESIESSQLPAQDRPSGRRQDFEFPSENVHMGPLAVDTLPLAAIPSPDFPREDWLHRSWGPIGRIWPTGPSRV